MSHSEGRPDEGDIYYLDPKEVLAQYSVEWVALRQSYAEVKQKLREVQQRLNEIDVQLARGEIGEQEHMRLYREYWTQSTQFVQVKREIEQRLSEIQRKIRRANRRLQEQEAEQQRRQRIEQEKKNAMVEWMSLRQGFDLVMARRREINEEMDRIEVQHRTGQISDEEYRRARVRQIGQLAELRTLETDIKRRLAELLETIRK